jgi:hypothetical protein
MQAYMLKITESGNFLLGRGKSYPQEETEGARTRMRQRTTTVTKLALAALLFKVSIYLAIQSTFALRVHQGSVGNIRRPPEWETEGVQAW